MYKCLIAEDSMIERDLLVMHISKIKNIQIIAECANGLAALEVLREKEIDIVVSDIDMPELSGIELIKSLKKPPVFIFISSYSEYAVESFSLDVIDYIIKPISFERMLKAFHKATEFIELKENSKASFSLEQATTLQAPFTKTVDAEEYFFIKETSGYTKLHMADVLFIESMGDFSKIHTIQNKKHIILIGLKNIMEQLPGKIFKRVHKQYIINMLHVVTIGLNDIHLTNQNIVPLSSAYKPELLEVLVEKKTLKRFC
ncbi:MAG: response regulator transcription factor [Chitinophagaceae bacterium]|nr:response regulator transcription factor [Chitinophagaceae bacterium]